MGISLQDATSLVTDNALRTQYGLILPPGARVAAYVRSGGVQTGDDGFIVNNLVQTLAAGLARVRAGLGDFVVCLPGHAENVDAAATAAFAANLLAGTKIIGVGKGSNTPTFSWTAAASKWTIGVNDVVITGLKLLLCGPNGSGINTTLALNITGNDCGFYFNEVEVGTATNIAVTALSVSGSASRYDISGNVFRAPPGIGGTVNTTLLISSTGSDGRVADNEMLTNATVATGVISVTGAAASLRILRNVISNSTPASVAAIAFANVAVTGQCAYNTLTVLSTGVFSAGVTGITVGGTNNLMGFFQNFAVNDPNKSGLLVPAVDT